MLFNVISLIVLFFIDRSTKILAQLYLVDNMPVLIPGIIRLHLLKGGNTGAAFGIFEGKTELLAVFSGVCCAILLYLIFRNKFENRTEKIGYILLCAGALGNLYDRAVEKTVTDFLEFLFIEFPIFNLADTMVDVGCLLIVIHLFFLSKDKKQLLKKGIDQ